MRRVHADTAATTRPDPAVVAAMAPWWGEAHANASSLHRRGEAARDAVEAARDQVARLLACAPEEIVFCSSGSESDNLALKGSLALAEAGRTRVVTTAIEHKAVLETARWLESQGHPLTVVPVRANGQVDPDRLAEALGPDVALVSVMAVNNETGVIQPLEEIGLRVKEAGARFHVDAVQAAGKLPISVDAWQADLVSIAGHKFHGPVGAAALFVRRRTRLAPLVHGGSHERGRRAGTHDVAAIVGFGVAAELAVRRLAEGEPARVAELGELLLARLLAGVPDSALIGDLNARLGGILDLCFRGVDGEAVLHELDRVGVEVSTGSACSSGEQGPSHVLTAMGLSPEDAHASVRFSLGREHTDDDIAWIGEVTPPIVERLRALAGPARAKSA